ncbi:MAG: cupin domain-containing protein, partial [Geminicoccaceae bacterium]
MQLRADFAATEAVDLAAVDWVASPMPGVERKMLDRIGDEVARATSVVRYAPKSRFSTHTHDGGEEFLVLQGTFGDEHGRYPGLTYVRNPPGTSHSPIVEEGCVILVKLRQFAADDLTPVCLDTTRDAGWHAEAQDRECLHLHRHGPEVVGLERLGAGATLERVTAGGGLELFLVEGRLDVAGGEHAAWSWFRLPAGSTFRARALAP